MGFGIIVISGVLCAEVGARRTSEEGRGQAMMWLLLIDEAADARQVIPVFSAEPSMNMTMVADMIVARFGSTRFQ